MIFGTALINVERSTFTPMKKVETDVRCAVGFVKKITTLDT